MTSRQSHRLRGDSSPKAGPKTDDQAAAQDKKPVRRRASVYDAVAGRVTSRLIKTNPSYTPRASSPTARLRDAASEPPLAPEEVLFRRKDAPPRYAEKDVYFAGTDALASSSSPTAQLPGSDLLKAVHGYAAGFYEAAAVEREARGRVGRVGGRVVDERSMDETALLAFGVLLEEAAREALGKNGDLVFTEGHGKHAGRGPVQVGLEGGGGGAGSGAEEDDLTPRSTPAKRRKLSRGSASA